jgi:hypothetical protein
MQEKPPDRHETRRDPPPTESEDATVQRAVLALLLAEHPTQMTVSELVGEVADRDDFAQRDAVERALRDLAAAGLVQRHRDLVLPTRAALHLDRLGLD